MTTRSLFSQLFSLSYSAFTVPLNFVILCCLLRGAVEAPNSDKI